MTKRYNLFNYGITWIGILIIAFSAAIAFVVIRYVFLIDESLIKKILIGVVSVLVIVFGVIPKGMMCIREGQKKAFNCDENYILGRVRADESRKSHIIHDLDCINALEYCNGKGCSHCPYRISCHYTKYTWMIESARLLFDKMEPCEEITKFSEIIDRFRCCKEEICYVGCPDYDNCVENNLESLQHDIYMFFKRKGYTSAEQIRKRNS